MIKEHSLFLMTKPLEHIMLASDVALIVLVLPVCILPIAATRAGSISHFSPAAEASSKTLRVTCIKGGADKINSLESSSCSKEVQFKSNV